MLNTRLILNFTSLLSVLILIVIGCNKIKETEAPKKLGKIQSAEKVFFEIDSLLKMDNGELWNQQLYGPILFVDKESRAFIANQNNVEEDINRINAVFQDILPEELNIANTAINWKGKRWSMVMLPLPEDRRVRDNLIIHELFHRAQPEIGLEVKQESSNAHLDSFEGRVLLKLELEALKRAINAPNKVITKMHIANALLFRENRYVTDDIKKEENLLELNEGLAEYTGVMLSGRTSEQIETHLIKSIDLFYSNPTFVRSFAYQTIPVYGYLLSKEDKNWQRKITINTNLSELFTSGFDLQMVEDIPYQELAKENDYNYQSIKDEEKERELERVAKLERLKRKFLKEPTLTLYFKNMNISFDPRNITPIEDIGTVYPNLRVTDEWGILSVDNGALLSANWGSVIISYPSQIENSLVYGDGWTLELNEGWKVNELNGSFELIKQ